MLFYFQVFYLFIYETFVCAQKVSNKEVSNRTVTLSDRGVIVGGFLFWLDPAVIADTAGF